MNKHVQGFKLFFKTYFYKLFLISILFNIMFLGGQLNFYAMIENGGRMPVHTGYYLNTENHFSFEEFNDVNYFFLTDILYLDSMSCYYSVGDILLIIPGIFIIYIIFQIGLLEYKRNKFKSNNTSIERFK